MALNAAIEAVRAGDMRQGAADLEIRAFPI
jgi:hypothetical protein